VHKQQKCLINQREVHRHTKSFKRALRAALREDPDIVLVGEMRDLETIEIAIETAETGHLVFGTLHTNTAATTVDRIIDQFPADRQNQIRTMLASSLKGVIAQTLCKKKPKGRAAALEVLIVNTAVAANIREGKTHGIISAMQMGGKLGMRLLNDSLLELVKAGTVEPNEAYVKAVNKEDLLTKFQANGFSVDLSKHGEASEPAPAAAAPGAPRRWHPAQPASEHLRRLARPEAVGARSCTGRTGSVDLRPRVLEPVDLGPFDLGPRTEGTVGAQGAERTAADAARSDADASADTGRGNLWGRCAREKGLDRPVRAVQAPAPGLAGLVSARTRLASRRARRSAEA
jgi:hypothetical protein